MLFATLETAVRKIDDGSRKPFYLADTVGFINNLPHGLVKAFRSTLEEIKEAESVLKIDVKDNEPVEEKVNLLKKLVSIMKEDDDGLLQLDLTSADDNDLAAQLKKAKTDSAVVDKYKNSLKEKQKSYNDTQEPFCANY